MDKPDDADDSSRFQRQTDERVGPSTMVLEGRNGPWLGMATAAGMGSRSSAERMKWRSDTTSCAVSMLRPATMS